MPLINNSRRLRATIRDVDGVGIDPASVIFRMQGPSTDVTFTYGTDAELVRESAGRYHVVWDFTASGRYLWTWAATGQRYATAQADIYIRPLLAA
jgi:hypothetical protein